MNLSALIDACVTRTGFADSDFRARWRDYLNEALREHARRYPWPGLEDYLELAVTNGQRYLTFPPYVQDVLAVHNLTDNQEIHRSGEFERTHPATFAQGTTGRPYLYEPVGHVPVVADPAGKLRFNSSHASDLDLVYVTGLAAASGASDPALTSLETVEEITAAGTSPVTLSTLFTKITSIGKATNTNGDFYFYDTGASPHPQLSVLPRDELEADFFRVQLHFIPDGAKTFRIRYRHKTPRLTNDSQHVPPGVDVDFLVHEAVATFHREKEQNIKAQVHAQKATDIATQRANQQENFGEPFSQIMPAAPPNIYDPSDDHFRGW